MTIHPGRALPHGSCCQPGPSWPRACLAGGIGSCRPTRAETCLTLLPVGLAMPPLLPEARWALTPPFHPCPVLQRRTSDKTERFDFCGAFRRVSPPGCYPAPLPCGVRTFLSGTSPSGHPAFRALNPPSEIIGIGPGGPISRFWCPEEDSNPRPLDS